MAKRKAVELTIHIKEARDLVAPSDAKGNPVPLNSSVSFSLLSLAKEETEVVADSMTPAYGFSTTLKLPTDDASLAQLVAAPLLLSVEADGVVRGVVRLDLAPLLEQAGLEEAWLPLAPGPEGGEVAGELLVAVEAETPLLSEDDLEESAVLTLRLGAVHKLPERWLLAEGEEADGHIFAYQAGVSFQVGAGLPPIEIPAGLIQLAIQPPAPVVAEGEGEAAAEAPADAPADAPEGEGEGEAAAAEPAPPPTEAEVGNAEEQAAQSISFDGMALRTFLGPAAMLALREAAESGVAPLTVTFAREVKNAETHIDPNAAKYRGLVEVPFAAMMAVDQTEGLVRAAVAYAAPAEVAEDAEEAAVDPKAKKEAPKKGAKGPEELPVEEEEEVRPQVDVATLALTLPHCLLIPTLTLTLTCRPCCCCRCTRSRRAAPTCACS